MKAESSFSKLVLCLVLPCCLAGELLSTTDELISPAAGDLLSMAASTTNNVIVDDPKSVETFDQVSFDSAKIQSLAGNLIEIDFSSLHPATEYVLVTIKDRTSLKNFYFKSFYVEEGTPTEDLLPTISVFDSDCTSVMIKVKGRYDDQTFDFSTDDVKILHNDEIVSNIKGPFWRNNEVYLVGLVGTCDKPSCSSDDDEILFEFESAGPFFSRVSLIDFETKELFYYLVASPFDYTYSYTCLPRRGQCYTLFNYNDVTYYDPLAFNVTVDGERVADFGSLPAAAFAIGECSQDMVSCADDESVLEIFIKRISVWTDKGVEMKWSIQQDNNSDEEHSGVVDVGEGGYLYYHRECIKSSSCARFILSVPELYEVETFPGYNETYDESGNYFLLLDGIMYGKNEYKFGTEPFSSPPEVRGFEDLTMVGECSENNGWCQSEESFLDVSIESSPVPDTRNPSYLDPILSSLLQDYSNDVTRDSIRYTYFATPLKYKHYACLDTTTVACALLAGLKEKEDFNSTFKVIYNGAAVGLRPVIGEDFLSYNNLWHLGGDDCVWPTKAPSPSQAPTKSPSEEESGNQSGFENMKSSKVVMTIASFLLMFFY